jgi:cytochrome c peroxidase
MDVICRKTAHSRVQAIADRHSLDSDDDTILRGEMTMSVRRALGAVVSAGLVLGSLSAWLNAGGNPPAQTLFPPNGPKIPLGLVEILWPEDNEYTPEKAELGWLLFFDKRLSTDGSVSCASCHSPEHGFGDGQPVSTGIKGQKGGRSAPSVINRVYGAVQFWDGRAASLEDQAKGPIANPIEMTAEKDSKKAHATCIERLKGVKEYRERFKKVFGTDDFTIDHVAMAIATFERTVLSGNSAFDKFKAGDSKALTESQQRGMKIFFSNNARCDSCHDGAAFTTNQFANIGIGMDKPDPDLGRFNVTKKEEEKGAFKTPGLRDIARTAPYMHDGSLKTLEEVVEHYDKGGIKNKWLHQDIRPLKLTKEDKADLVQFLHALNGEGWQHLTAPKSLPK